MVRVEEGQKNLQKEMIQIHKRIDSLSSTIKWLAGIGFAYISILMTVLKFFG